MQQTQSSSSSIDLRMGIDDLLAIRPGDDVPSLGCWCCEVLWSEETL